MPPHVDIIACPAGEMGPGNTRNSEGAIIELADGRLLMAYTRAAQKLSRRISDVKA